jgi:copper chaperone CopZ
MSCPDCANRIRNSFLSLYGVIDAYVDHSAGIAQVSFNPAIETIDDLISAVGGICQNQTFQDTVSNLSAVGIQAIGVGDSLSGAQHLSDT